MNDRVDIRRGSIRVFEDGLYWEFAGRRRRVEDVEPVAHVGDLESVPARDLANALRRAETLWGETALRVVTDSDPDDDLEYLVLSPISFALADRKLAIDVDFFAEAIPADEKPTGEFVKAIRPLLMRKRMWVLSETEDLDNDGRLWHVALRLGFHLRGQSVAGLVRDGMEIVELLAATTGGLTRTTCADLIRSGHVGALLGQTESDWLEVKREHYPLSHLAGKVRLAGVVAQFANAEHGGLAVVGLQTKTRGGIDVIDAITPQPNDVHTRRQYIQALQSHLFPPPEGLTIEMIAVDGGDLVLVEVPDQPEELKPFLVHGAVVDGQARGSFISIVRRIGDESIATTPAAIHATLAAGRALLRRGNLPPQH